MASAMAIASAVIEHRGCPSEAEGRAELHATWYRRNRGVLENRHLQLKNRPSDTGHRTVQPSAFRASFLTGV